MKASQTHAALPKAELINDFDEPPFTDEPLDYSNVANMPVGGSSRNGSSLA